MIALTAALSLMITNDLILYRNDDTTNTVHQVEVKTKIG